MSWLAVQVFKYTKKETKVFVKQYLTQPVIIKMMNFHIMKGKLQTWKSLAIPKLKKYLFFVFTSISND